MRADRLVSLLLLLQARGRMTARALAAELEVSERTVYRDAAALVAAGIPLLSEAGSAGGYRLMDGYRTRLTGLTRPEAQALSLSALPGPAAALGLGAVAASAGSKLAAALPPDLAAHARRVSSTFHLDTSSWYHEAEQPAYLVDVAAATWEQRLVEVDYHRWRAPQDVTRVLAPYGLVLKSGAWYLLAAHDDRLATYRVAQMTRVALLDNGFDRPGDFDLARQWRSSVDEFERRQQHQGRAVMLVTADGLEALVGHATPAVARAATASATESSRPGWLRVDVPIESVEHACADVLRLGAEAEVLAPAALRDRLREAVTALVGRYA